MPSETGFELHTTGYQRDFQTTSNMTNNRPAVTSGQMNNFYSPHNTPRRTIPAPSKTHNNPQEPNVSASNNSDELYNIASNSLNIGYALNKNAVSVACSVGYLLCDVAELLRMRKVVVGMNHSIDNLSKDNCITDLNKNIALLEKNANHNPIDYEKMINFDAVLDKKIFRVKTQ